MNKKAQVCPIPGCPACPLVNGSIFNFIQTIGVVLWGMVATAMFSLTMIFKEQTIKIKNKIIGVFNNGKK